MLSEKMLKKMVDKMVPKAIAKLEAQETLSERDEQILITLRAVRDGDNETAMNTPVAKEIMEQVTRGLNG